MKRRILVILSVVWLVLCLASILLRSITWLSHYGVAVAVLDNEPLTNGGVRRSLFGVSVAESGVAMYWGKIHFTREFLRDRRDRSWRPGTHLNWEEPEALDIIRDVFEWSASLSNLGFPAGQWRHRFPTVQRDIIYVGAPWWFLVAITLPPSILIVRRVVRKRRRRRLGLCPSCGYDLRGSTSRCPECGHEIGAQAAQSG